MNFKKCFLALGIFLFSQFTHANLITVTSAWNIGSVVAGSAAGQLLPVRYIKIHGWWDGMDCTTEYCYPLWGGGSTLSVTREVTWNTSLDWRYEGVSRLETVLNRECQVGVNRCVIICHSTGCAITAKLLDAKNNWPIEKVLALGSAEGGSELAEYASGVGRGSGIQFITPSVVRNAYDHNDTGGVPFIHLAGYDTGDSLWLLALPAGLLYTPAFILPGEDDGTVAFHSACAYSQVFNSNYCSGDYTMVWRRTWYGLKYVARGVAQWTNHARSEYCGRDGCDKTHLQLTNAEFQDQAKVAEPANNSDQDTIIF